MTTYVPSRSKIINESGFVACVAAGPSRPTPALPIARQSAKARVIARRRSRPGADSGSPSTSMITLLVPDVDDPLLAEEVERGVAALSVAETGVLHATEWHMSLATQRWQVHVEHPGLGFLRVPERGAEIVRVDRRREAVADGVRGRERRLEVVRWDQAHHRAKDLFLGKRRARVHIREDRGLDEVARPKVATRRRAAVTQHLRAGALALVD